VGFTTATKTVTINVTALAQSSNANLASLSVSAGAMSPSFNHNTTSYSFSVANGVTSTTVTPTLADTKASVRVNGSTVASGAASSSQALNVGANVITVLVTAENGTTKTYTVTVTRTAAPALSSNANLASLTVSAGAMSPSFNQNTTSYSFSVANGVTSTTVTPTLADTKALVRVNGSAVTSGSPSSAQALNVGANPITVLVTAENGTTKTYSVTVTRAAAPALNSNANLASLTVSAGTLSPSFNQNTASYSFSVANGVTSTTVTPTLADTKATVRVNGTTVSSGAASGSQALNVGANSITVLVTAENGSTKTYTVTVTRAAPVAADPWNLIAFWDFNSLTNLVDLVDGIVGTARSGAKVTSTDKTGHSGETGDRALDLVGANGSVKVSVVDWLNEAAAANKITIAFWQKLRNTGRQTTFKAQSPSSTSNGQEDQRGISVNSPWTDNNVYFDTGGCCGSNERVNATAPGNVNWRSGWHHLAFVKDGSTKQIWVNGNLLIQGTNTKRITQPSGSALRLMVPNPPTVW
jgi:hypothetical protein